MSQVINVSDPEKFDFDQEVLEAQTPVLLYFWADWCGPCKLVSPSIEWAAKNYGDRLKVFKLKVDAHSDTVKHCKVEGVPALRLYQDREMVKSHEGAIGKQTLQAMLDNHCS
ncbi:MAG: thioredoxin family protein [Jaaginema sp. PMC 1079.18]|nr:thioredoxin family protein [Jaaginema sp. PMC 1080.18]MEC4853864.1 thioredoxin family protein [Jaaginema sp. PMC 1079.18]MEC4868569.1 thioredoxin family protein [Jaaginema sp. PMC 1078.18]